MGNLDHEPDQPLVLSLPKSPSLTGLWFGATAKQRTTSAHGCGSAHSRIPRSLGPIRAHHRPIPAATEAFGAEPRPAKSHGFHLFHDTRPRDPRIIRDPRPNEKTVRKNLKSSTQTPPSVSNKWLRKQTYKQTNKQTKPNQTKPNQTKQTNQTKQNKTNKQRSHECVLK